MIKLLLFLVLMIPKPPHHKLWNMWFYIPNVLDIAPPNYVLDLNCEPIKGDDVYIYSHSAKAYGRCIVKI